MGDGSFWDGGMIRVLWHSGVGFDESLEDMGPGQDLGEERGWIRP